jgi:hypothetical protein
MLKKGTACFTVGRRVMFGRWKREGLKRVGMKVRSRMFCRVLSLAMIVCAVSCGGDSQGNMQKGDSGARSAASADGGRSRGTISPLGGSPIGSRNDGGSSIGAHKDDAGSADSGTAIDSGASLMDSGTAGCATATFGVSTFGESCFGK